MAEKTLRGQAAMEYLATYGWAIFALFIVVALMFATGVFGAGRFAVEECSIQPNIPCSGYYMYYNKTDSKMYVGFDLVNSMGSDVLWRNVTITLADGVPATVSATPAFVHQGQKASVLMTASMTAAKAQVNSQKKAKMNIQFSVCEGYPTQTACDAGAVVHSTAGKLDAFVRQG